MIRKEIWSDTWTSINQDDFNPVLLSCQVSSYIKPIKVSLSRRPCRYNYKENQEDDYGRNDDNLNNINNQNDINNSKNDGKSNSSDEDDIKEVDEEDGDKTLIVRNAVNNVDNFFVTVCIKPLDFDKDITINLMQWFEINKLFGADGFDVYVRNVHPNVMNLLKFYQYDKTMKFHVYKYENIEDFVRRNKKFKRKRKMIKLPKNNRDEVNGVKLLNKNNIINNDVTPNGGSNKYLNRSFSFSNGEIELWKNENEEFLYNDDRTVTYNKKNNNNEKDNDYDNSINGDVDDDDDNKKNIRKLWQKRKNELISYNDCFYRNIHASAFVLPIDIDEIIVPKHSHRTWKDVITSLVNEKPEMLNYASFSVQNTYFLKRFPTRDRHESVFFFKHVSRTEFSPPGESSKSFVSTKNALTVFNHYSLDVLRPGITNIYFTPNSHLQMNHYRKTCSIDLLPECVKYNLAKYEDINLLKYKKEFYKIYKRTLRNFKNFIKNVTNVI